MIQCSEMPEYTLAEKSARMYPQWAHGRTSILDWDQVIAELEQLSKACQLATDLLGRITDSQLALVLSLQDQV